MSANCSLGLFLYATTLCAPCPPHTVGVDGLTCVRCPADSFASGLGNTACTPCLGSNMTTDALACPVLVPEYYYTAASSAGVAMLLLVLLVAAICVLQKRSKTILTLRMQTALATGLRRIIGTGNEAGARTIVHQTSRALAQAQEEDEDDLHLDLDDEADTHVPAQSAVDFATETEAEERKDPDNI